MTTSLDTLFTARKIISLDTVVSTNTYLSELQRSERLPEGTAVTALFQDGGRGQYGHNWHSEKGENLLVSYLFYPSFLDAHRLHFLNMTFAVAVSDAALSFLNEGVSIKWPNDVYHGAKKLAGLLVENVLGEEKLRQSILGVGFNVNQLVFPESVPNPVSLHLSTGKHIHLEEVFNVLSNALEKRYLQLRGGGFQELRAVYHQRLYLHGKWEWFETAGRKFKGMIMGVNRDGQLMLQEESGHSSVYDMKQIRYVMQN